MPTKKDKSYQIRLQCEKCRKFIDVDLHVKMTERDRYGKPETYVPTKIPKYLEIVFEQGIGQLFRQKESYQMSSRMSIGIGSAGIQNPVYGSDEPIIVCKTCQQIKKLKE